MSLRAKLFQLTLATLFLTGCNNTQPPLELGAQDWKPKGIGGPVVAFPLPPASTVISDFKKWESSESSTNARVYEVTIATSNQTHFQTKTIGGDTPMGFTIETWGSFIYQHSEKGVYELFFDRRGQHSMDFLKPKHSAKTFWVIPNGNTNAAGVPQLRIVGIEGVKPDWGVPALAGHSDQKHQK
jgi:hypothetical protein